MSKTYRFTTAIVLRLENFNNKCLEIAIEDINNQPETG